MALYTYRGRNEKGRILTGETEVPSEDALASQLAKQNITLISFSIKVKELSFQERFYKTFSIGIVKLSELEVFCRQMYTLTRAGVPLIRGMRVVAESTQDKRLKDAVTKVAASIQAGHSLATSLQEHTLVFPSLMVAMVNVGENTGRLDQAFIQLANHFENEIQTRKLMKAAVRYPFLVVTFVLVAVGLVNVLVIPSFAEFFNQFDAQLPWQTKILLTSSYIMVNYWFYIVLGLILATLGIMAYLNTENGKSVWDRLKLKIPLIGSIIKRGTLARFARTFSMTTGAGVPIQQTFTVCARSVDNAHLSEKIMRMRTGVEQGDSFSTTAITSGLFTPMILQMIAIGEETGSVEKLLEEVALHYERDVSYDVKRLGDAIEPIMITFIALMVLILALGVFLPMWELASVALNQ